MSDFSDGGPLTVPPKLAAFVLDAVASGIADVVVGGVSMCTDELVAAIAGRTEGAAKDLANEVVQDFDRHWQGDAASTRRNIAAMARKRLVASIADAVADFRVRVAFEAMTDDKYVH